ncbi:MAG: SpoIIE family protein phosphatase [Deltaproteobacteria bacterium]|nr:SpoIIE family protein phosphatase [Deltaproteobacteria bacterium]
MKALAALSSEIKPLFGPIRDRPQIPSPLWNFFQWDPLENKPLSADKALLYCQVYCHEAEELLAQRPKDLEDLNLSLKELLKQFHPISLLLHLREKNLKNPQGPYASPFLHKARYNQQAKLKGQMGEHPYLAFTHPGEGYKNQNEDGILLQNKQKMLILSDGMGGLSKGYAASGVVLDFLEKALNEDKDPLQAAIQAQEALLARSKLEKILGQPSTLGCTLVMAQIAEGYVQIWHMGDSKAMVIREGKILSQTQDHSKGQELFYKRLVNEETARQLGHILSRGLGDSEQDLNQYMEKTRIPLQEGDRLLLATDGITDNYFGKSFDLSSLAQAASLPSLEESLDHIQQNCLEKMRLGIGKPDNLRLALLDYQA